MDLTDRQAAEDWIDRNQLGRRNLSPDTASLLRGRIYNRTKKAAHDGGKGGTRTGGQNVPHLKTAESLAKVYGVTSRTIKRDGQFARAVEVVKQADPTIEQQVHSGKVAKQSVVAAAAELEPFFAEDAKRRQKKAGEEHGRGQKVVVKLPQAIERQRPESQKHLWKKFLK